MEFDEKPGRQMASKLFHQVLEEQEPPLPQVTNQLRIAGARLRRRRQIGIVALATSTAIVAAVVATGVITQPWRSERGLAPAAAAPAEPSDSASAGGSSAAAPDPEHPDLGPEAMKQLQSQLLTSLSAHLPASVSGIREGNGPTNFTLVRPDGSTLTIAGLTGNPIRSGTRIPSPCEPVTDPITGQKTTYGSECRFKQLPGGLSGWLYATTDPHANAFLLATRQGKIIGLDSTDRDNARPGGPLTLDELFSFAAAPDVLNALQGVPFDTRG